jgi:CRISPR-associated exonuclease Cas4
MVPEKERMPAGFLPHGRGHSCASEDWSKDQSDGASAETLEDSLPYGVFSPDHGTISCLVVHTSSILILLIPSLLILALLLHFLSNQSSQSAKSIRRVYGIPEGEVIYSDLNRPAKALYSKKLGISGKPDYIVKDDESRCMIPVEVKSGRAGEPHRNHILQLAAYCLLVEETFRLSVPYGIIVYADGVQHKIDFGNDLRSDLLSTVLEMRSSLKSGCPRRDHNHKGKCRFCSMGHCCNYRLAD